VAGVSLVPTPSVLATALQAAPAADGAARIVVVSSSGHQLSETLLATRRTAAA
jgi:hypothetical protein